MTKPVVSLSSLDDVEFLSFEVAIVLDHQPLAATTDVAHSDKEERFLLLGKTGSGRKLFVVCTIRGELVRVVSARDMTRLEREVYYTHG